MSFAHLWAGAHISAFPCLRRWTHCVRQPAGRPGGPAHQLMGSKLIWVDATRDCAGYHGFHEQGRRYFRPGSNLCPQHNSHVPLKSALQTVAERTNPTQRQSVQENSYVAHVHSRPASDGICGVLVSDTEYPTRVAFSLLNKTLDEFVIKIPKSKYESQVNRITTGGATQPAKGEGVLNAQHDFPQAQEYLTRYQDPRQADTIMKVQQELDETKIVLVSLTPLKGTRKSNLSDKLSSLYACSTKRSSRSYKEERTWIS